MIEDIKFMTVSCKFGATAQRKILEGKYPSHPVYSRELYNAIQKFRRVLKDSSHPPRLPNLSQEIKDIAENVGRLATIKKIARYYIISVCIYYGFLRKLH